MEMYTLDKKDETVVIRLEQSRIDVKSTRQLSEALASIEDSFQRYVIDLSNVTHMDSSAVGTLVAYKQRITKTGKKVVLCNLSAFLQEIFNILRMDTVFEISPDLETAMQA